MAALRIEWIISKFKVGSPVNRRYTVLEKKKVLKNGLEVAALKIRNLKLV